MMEFRIADTFIDSLARLNAQEQKAVKTSVFDLQVNPSHPGLSFHKLERIHDAGFASVRVNRDVRIIVHRMPESLLLCYVGHHEAAYHWAERRKLETHPITGAAQLVEIRETVQEILVPMYVAEEPVTPRLFAERTDDELLAYGVPPEWLEDVRQSTEDSYLDLAGHLPAEAAEALLELAVGGTPQPTPAAETAVATFEHPDALRRFRLVGDADELLQALEYPWDKWVVFLHPEQRSIVTASYHGPVRISGSAGTGKTVVALHRAVHLAKVNPAARILLTTFSQPLAQSLRNKLRMLLLNQPTLAEQIEVYALNEIGERLYRLNLGDFRLASFEDIRGMLAVSAARVEGHSFKQKFLMTEWQQVVDAWQIDRWEAYRDVLRLGRKTRLAESLRKTLWSIFEPVKTALKEHGGMTYAELFNRLSALYAGGQSPPFDFIVVDEAQDIDIAQLKFLSSMAGKKPDSLFFSGDLGQRIFQQPFSWKALGIDIRGRAKTLRINYRTSHQIRMQADKLLGPEIADVDGNMEKRSGTISVFNGPVPTVETFEHEQAEIEAVAVWLSDRVGEGIQAGEIGVFVRSEAQISRATSALETAALEYRVLDEKIRITLGAVSISTMHLAKGLEFRAVVVMACDDEVIPLQERIETATDTSDLEDVYNTERHLLYVACTRARDQLLVTGVVPGSEFLDDMMM